MVLGKNYLKENVVGFDCDVGGVQEDARQIVLAEWVANIGDSIPWLDFLDLQGT